MPQVCCLAVAVVRLLFSSLFVLEPSSENSATPIIFYGSAIGVDNGVGVTPPMGWRHWKAFAAHIDQTILSNMADELVVQRDVDGVPTSLADLGYIYVGLDDHWQNCTRTCANGTVIPSWHEVHDYGE